MAGIGTQERRNVRRTGQQVEATGLDRLDVTTPQTQTLFDIDDTEAERFALVAQQTTDSAARRGLAFSGSPIDLIRHQIPLAGPF